MEKKKALWIKASDETIIKDLLRSKGLAFWSETGVFSFHLLTAVATSIIWLAVIMIL